MDWHLYLLELRKKRFYVYLHHGNVLCLEAERCLESEELTELQANRAALVEYLWADLEKRRNEKVRQYTEARKHLDRFASDAGFCARQRRHLDSLAHEIVLADAELLYRPTKPSV